MKNKTLLVISALACAVAFTACDPKELTPEQRAQFEAYQAAQMAKAETAVANVTAAVHTATAVATPLAAVIPGAQPVAAVAPLVNDGVQIVGGIALAGLALWQRIKATRYKNAGESMIAALEKVPDAKPIVAQHAREDGTGDFLHGWVKENTYAAKSSRL